MNRRPDARTAGHRGSSAGQSEISPLVRKGLSPQACQAGRAECRGPGCGWDSDLGAHSRVSSQWNL